MAKQKIKNKKTFSYDPKIVNANAYNFNVLCGRQMLMGFSICPSNRLYLPLLSQ
jgi:hypothetical protein